MKKLKRKEQTRTKKINDITVRVSLIAADRKGHTHVFVLYTRTHNIHEEILDMVTFMF